MRIISNKSSLINYSVDFIIAAAMSFSFVYAFTSTLEIDYSAKNVFFLVCFVLAIYSILFINKMAIKISVALIAFAAVDSIFYYYINPQEFKGLYGKIVLVFSWLRKFNPGGALLGREYQKYILIVLTLIISLAIYIFVIKKFNFYILLIGGVSIFAAQWIIGYFVIYFSFYVFLGFIIICYFKHIYVKNARKSHVLQASTAIFLLFSVPICAIVFFSAYYMPVSEKPMKWSWLDSKIELVDRYIKSNFNVGNSEYFSINSTGFGKDSTKLGGNISLSDTIVMKVDSSEGDIYLKGAVRDRYTGASWENAMGEQTTLHERSQLNGFNEDLIELSEGMKVISGRLNVLDDISNKTSIDITYENLKTKTIFIPSKVDNLTFEKENFNLVVDAYGMISNEKFLGKNFKYTAELYNINKKDQGIEAFLRNSRRGLYSRYEELIFKNSNKYKSGSLSRSEIEKLIGMSDNTYARYLQLPKELPERVSKLAGEITSSADNDYDRAKAIEAYLSKNYVYTLEPGDVPENRDFVDYFLFDSKQGYCTYYASAMTILVRSLGIPARYVEGYILPSKPVSGSSYEVTNKEAHAWVEVYFEGFGWIPFEPTAPYAQSINNVPRETSNKEEAVTKQTQVEENNQVKPDQKNNNSSEDLPTETIDNGAKVQKVPVTNAAIIIFAILLLWILCFSTIKRRIFFYRLEKLSSQESVMKMYKYYLKALSVQGLKMKSGETPLKYAKRIDEALEFKKVSFETITDIFNKACYSNSPIDKEEMQLIINFYSIFQAQCKEKIGWFRYFIYNKIFGII
ncbi:transglutaminase domain-containing protein [Clostridium sp. C2-6-12]|uniref:transglutaminase TgpA family protein n=1 Tax=Clostridium sp. C2-6-12 TaxID=2698832 RepID=UPI00136ECA5F|nr:transglutaminase domain-containing protein [Clostridium sp. C2-6-12]